MKIEIKRRYTGEVLFAHDEENNTIKRTVCVAVNAKKSLAGADLRGAYLAGACLDGADFSRADLTGVNLNGASLDGAKNIMYSNDVLAVIAADFDASLKPVAAMIRGRMVGCWEEYTKVIREVFGDDTIKRLAEAWLQDEAWGVRERLEEHGWIAPQERITKAEGSRWVFGRG